jgi:hypothetical protein
MTIQASLAGEHREATAMFASKDGEWIPVPMGGGGGSCDLEWAPRDFTLLPAVITANFASPATVVASGSRITINIPAQTHPGMATLSAVIPFDTDVRSDPVLLPRLRAVGSGLVTNPWTFMNLGMQTTRAAVVPADTVFTAAVDGRPVGLLDPVLGLGTMTAPAGSSGQAASRFFDVWLDSASRSIAFSLMAPFSPTAIPAINIVLDLTLEQLELLGGGGGGGGEPEPELLASGVTPGVPVSGNALWNPNFVPNNTGTIQTATVPAGAVPVGWSFGSIIAQSTLPVPGVQFGDALKVKIPGASFRMERPLTAPATWTEAAASVGGTTFFFPASVSLQRCSSLQGRPSDDWVNLSNGWRGRWEFPALGANFVVEARPGSLLAASDHMWPIIATLPDLELDVVVTGADPVVLVQGNLPGWGAMSIATPAAVPAEFVALSTEWPVVEVWSND